MKKGKEIREIIIQYDADKFCGIWRLEKFFLKAVKEKRKVPSTAIKILLSIIRIKEHEQRKQVKKLLSPIRKSVLKRYEKEPEYGFNYRYFTFDLLGRKENRVSVNRTFRDMTDNLFHELEYKMCDIYFEKTAEKNLKEELANIINKNIADWSPPDYKRYKRYAIINYIMWHLGFYFSKKITPAALGGDGKEPTNKELYETIKHTLNKGKSTK